jgi:ClpX C4-type zinc finger
VKEAKDLVREAQRAEVIGNKKEASRLLREAAASYAQASLPAREQKMLRHAERLEGDEWGFGDSLLADDVERAAEPARTLVEKKGPELAERERALWCSFCCRPNVEVGALVAGVTGVYVCAECVVASAHLLQVAVEAPMKPQEAEVSWLPWQAQALVRFRAQPPTLPLIFGPAGSGKHFLARHLGRVPLTPLARVVSNSILISQAPAPLAAVRLPDGTDIFDTASLGATLPDYAPEVLAQVDAVFVFASPASSDLLPFLRAWCQRDSVVLPDDTLDQLTQVAQQSGRGMVELKALFSRLPKRPS